MNELIDNACWPLNTPLVSERYRVIYTPIAKNANTSLKRLFVRLSGHPDTDALLQGEIHQNLVTRSTGLVLGDYSREEATRILADERYFHFTVLRNPLERAVSGFLEKFVISPPSEVGNPEFRQVVFPLIESVYAARGEPADAQRSITFAEFAGYLADTPDEHLDTHFKSQGAFLQGQSIDYFGTLEHTGGLVKILEEKFRQPIGLEWINRTSHRKPLWRRRSQPELLPAQLRKQRSLPHASELLTAELSRLLSDRFADDLALWRSALG